MLQTTWQWLVEAAAWGTALLCLAMLVGRWCGPAARAAWLACGLAAAVLVPTLRALETPRVPVAVWAAEPAASWPDAPRPAAVEVATAAVSQKTLAAERPATTAAPTTRVRPTDVLSMLYLFVAGGLGVRLLAGRWRLVRIASKAAPIADPDLSVRLLQSDAVAGPMMYGLLRPTILLPTDLPEDARRTALAHERSHAERGDAWAATLANVAATALWWNPLAWAARRGLLLAQDRIADAAAAGDRPADYAELLMSMAGVRATPAALGFGGRRSRLGTRVRLLLSEPTPETRMPRGGRAVILAATAAAAFLTAGVRLVAAEPEGPPQASELPPAPDTEGLTYEGRLVDADTGEGIAGGRVTVWHKLSRDPQTGGWSVIESVDHVTDADGRWTVTVPPEQAAQDSLYLEVEASHPDYQPKNRGGYSEKMLRKNRRAGDPPWFANLKLHKADPVVGRLVDADGRPLSGATIKATPMLGRGNYTWLESVTDGDGAFRVPAAADTPVVICFLPNAAAPVQGLLGKDERSLGDIVCPTGTSVTGRVTDEDGEPVEGVWVTARGNPYTDAPTEDAGPVWINDPATAVEALRENSVADMRVRSAQTDADGRYTLPPLGAGAYDVRISPENDALPYGESRHDYAPEPLRHVFLQADLRIEADQSERTLDLQARPQTVLRGRYVDSDGEPRTGHQAHIFGRIGERPYFAESTRPGQDGRFLVRYPKGLERPELRLVTNEHSAIRFRIGDGPLRHGMSAWLDEIEDVEEPEITVVRYTAPILLVTVKNAAGETVEAELSSKYGTNRMIGPNNQGYGYFTGDVSFERQPDGRYRSSQMLPGEETKLTAAVDGRTSEPVTVTLDEGETREVTLSIP